MRKILDGHGGVVFDLRLGVARSDELHHTIVVTVNVPKKTAINLNGEMCLYGNSHDFVLKKYNIDPILISNLGRGLYSILTFWF